MSDALEALRELDERCAKAEATLAGAALADRQHRSRLDAKRQGVSLVRDYIRASLAFYENEPRAAGELGEDHQ